jgi:hypothetical protein
MQRGLRFAPLRSVARNLGWCDHDYPPSGEGTGGRLPPPVLGAPALSWGRSFQSTWLRPFVLDRNICNFLWYGVVEGGLRAKVLGRLGWCPSSNQEHVLYPAHRSPFIGPGLSGSGLYNVLWPRCFLSYPSFPARPSLCALEALRKVVGGANMTTPGGAGTPRCKHVGLAITPRARSTGFYHGVGAPRLQG